jgi:uncharacterized protein YdhG (YjbR/CyaY superfamily)
VVEQQFADVDGYVRGLPEAVRPVVEEIRQAIHRAVPGVGETISYHMPTFTLDGRRIVHLAAWKQHISIYPAPEGILDEELAPYRSDKSTLKFPLRRPIPYDLIGRVAAALAHP